MGFLHPELLLLSVPAAVAWWFVRGASRGRAIVRAIVLASLVFAAAGPYTTTSRQGRDLVIVADRSRSMPEDQRDVAMEIARLAEDARREGDRVAVVSFGASPRIEQLPSEVQRFSRFAGAVDADGSDVAAALETALELVPDDRNGAILLISDGESNGRDPVSVARRAFARGVRVDVRPCPRPDVADVSVERIDLPESTNVLEPFQFTVWVRADRRVEGSFELSRDGRVLSTGRRVFEAGLNRVVLRDVVAEAGVAAYRVAVDAGEDRVRENDAAIGATRVDGARSILVLNDDGAEDTLVRLLRAARLPVVVSTPEGARLDAIALSRHRAVVLENVAASRLGSGMRALAAYVHDAAGGLLVTGGKSSFGTGGYFKSALDEALPVSMEMRQEHRKQGIGLSIALDRSGSMMAPVAGGMVKMDLANLGTAAAIELLSPIDSVSVLAVDTDAHVIQPQVQATDVEELLSSVRRIRSEGGGIYVYQGLLGAANQLRDAPQSNRHIILFADAADAEEPGDYQALLADLEKAAITTSVVALGTALDSDAKFLEDVARRGHGQIYFTTDPTELPRLFAQDTLTVSRATFVEEATACDVTPGLFGLGEVTTSEFPVLGGYNLTYLRPGATAGVVTRDDYHAPVFAFQQHGLGRTAAFTGQIGGKFGGALVDWPGFASFFTSIARWLAGQEEPSEVFASVRREGATAVVSVEIDPDHADRVDTGRLALRVRESDGRARDVTLERVGENRFEARTPLAKEGVQMATLSLGDGRTMELPPVALPYSPEFERGPDPRRGETSLREIARESGGRVAPTVDELFRGDRRSRGWRSIGIEVLSAALLLVLLEIAGRRLELWGSLRVPAFVTRAFAAWRDRLARRRPATVTSSTASSSRDGATSGPETTSSRTSSTTTAAAAQSPASPPPAAPPPTIESALEKARRAAGRRLDR